MSTDLAKCESLRLQFGTGFEQERYRLLKKLRDSRFKDSSELFRFHELACFARAWPDSRRILRLTSRILSAFDRRADVQRFQRQLEGTGIAGSEIHYSFYLPTARWLARRWPGRLRIARDGFQNDAGLDNLLKHMALFAERQGLNDFGYQGGERIATMQGAGDTDAALFLSLFDLLPMADPVQETFFDELGVEFVLRTGQGAPSTTTASIAVEQIHYQDEPLEPSRIDLKRDARQRFAIAEVSRARARRLITLARGVMVSRYRDLDPIAYADSRDVRVVDGGQGIQIVLYGVIPERRLLLECEYGYLLLKNGVPVGYGSTWTLYGTCQVNFNLFATFRGSQAALFHARVVAAFQQLFGADTFVAEPYQLGDENEEALQSGAWWFYVKLGYLPHEPGAMRLAQAEFKKKQKRKGYRTPPSLLRRLALAPVFLHLSRRRNDILGKLELARCGVAVAHYLSANYGAKRARAQRECEKQVVAWLGIDRRALSHGQRLWLRRWGPLIASLKSVRTWSAGDRNSLAAVILAKGDVDQTRYVRLFDSHKRLRSALVRLAEKGL